MKNALAGLERAVFWTLAFAAFMAAAAGLGARAVDRIAVDYGTQRSTYAIVRVIAPEGPAGMATAESALASAPHVTSAAPMTSARAAALLAQWSGDSVRAEDVAALPLIELELAPTDSGADVSGDILAALAQSGVTGEVIEAPTGAGSTVGGADGVRTAALLGAIAVAAVMALIISLAARSMAARRRELVTVMCDLGATRTQAAGRIADEAAVLGLYAGLVGGGLAAVAGLIVMLLAIPGASIETLPRMILPIDLAPIVAAPLVAAVAAGFGARAAAGYFHGKAARLG